MSERGAGLGKDDVEEFGIGDSSILVKVKDLVEVVDVLFKDVEIIVSQEVMEFPSGDISRSISINSLEGSVWFEIGLFSENLTIDFDLLLPIRDSFKKVS